MTFKTALPAEMQGRLLVLGGSIAGIVCLAIALQNLPVATALVTFAVLVVKGMLNPVVATRIRLPRYLARWWGVFTAGRIKTEDQAKTGDAAAQVVVVILGAAILTGVIDGLVGVFFGAGVRSFPSPTFWGVLAITSIVVGLFWFGLALIQGLDSPGRFARERISQGKTDVFPLALWAGLTQALSIAAARLFVALFSLIGLNTISILLMVGLGLLVLVVLVSPQTFRPLWSFVLAARESAVADEPIAHMPAPAASTAIAFEQSAPASRPVERADDEVPWYFREDGEQR